MIIKFKNYFYFEEKDEPVEEVEKVFYSDFLWLIDYLIGGFWFTCSLYISFQEARYVRCFCWSVYAHVRVLLLDDVYMSKLGVAIVGVCRMGNYMCDYLYWDHVVILATCVLLVQLIVT